MQKMKTIRHRFTAFIPFMLTIAVLCCLLGNGLPRAAAVQADTDSYYLSENSNVDTIRATTVGALPCIGEAKILVFYVDFKGGETNWTKSKAQVEDMFFSETGKTDPSVAYSEADSLRSYYYRSSYGKVDITGTVIEYQTQQDTSYYTSFYSVLTEVIEYHRDLVNWDEYDANNDGYVDGIYLIARNKHSFGGPNFVSNYSFTVGDKSICKACFLDVPDFSTMCHETCHMFGPGDMFAAVSVNPAGIQTACIMDNGCGDLPGPTKFVLGWLDNAVFVSSDNIGTHNLRSYTNYGDALIIYPNGDPTNKNWFFVEFVTNEGNNSDYRTQGGLRVWKTQMNVDENYDITGAKAFCSGMPNSPYEYLEAVHPDNVWNYYFPVGQEITPYTYPSTAYSNTFYNEGGAKFLKDLTFSGVHISFTGVENGTATVDVNIEASANTAKTANATITALAADQSSAFLDSKTSICFAMLSSDIELKDPSAITLTSASCDDEYAVEVIKSNNHRTLQLCIAPSILPALKEHNDWTISIPGVTTYYGGNLIVRNGAETFDFANYPTPLIDCGGQYETGFYMSFPFELKCFPVSNSTIMTIYYDNTSTPGKLYWAEVNTETNTTTKTELYLPDNVAVNGQITNDAISVWEDYGVYFVRIANYICCYDSKEFISCLNVPLPFPLSFQGSDGNSFFCDLINRQAYKMTFRNNVIALEPLDIDLSYINTFDLKGISSFKPNQYVVRTNKAVRFLDIEKDIVKEYVYEDNNEHSITYTQVYFLNDHYYVFTSSVDLILYKYDLEFNLLSETCILKDLSTTIWGPFKLHIDFIHNGWFIYFDSVSNANAMSYANSYLITCSERGQVIYCYKYGASDGRYVCQFIPISQNKVICLSAFSYQYIRTDCAQHSLGDWSDALAPTCTAEGFQRRDCEHCSYFETRGVAATQHSFNDKGICTKCNPQQYLPGDLDDNHSVDLNDVVYLLLHTMFGEGSYPIGDASVDMDGSGFVNQDDAIYLLLHIMFGELIYPLHITVLP